MLYSHYEYLRRPTQAKVSGEERAGKLREEGSLRVSPREFETTSIILQQTQHKSE